MTICLFSEQVMHRMCSKSSVDVTDAPDTYTDVKTIDAFISYRRLNGAQLARYINKIITKY